MNIGAGIFLGRVLYPYSVLSCCQHL